MNKFLLVLMLTCPLFAAKFYVNLNNNHNYALQGKTADSAFGGAIGLQRYFDTCAAGDTALVYGNGDQRKINWLPYAIASGAFGRGDTLVNITRAGSAVVYQDSAAIKMLVEVQSGAFANGDSVRNNQSSIFAKLNAAPVLPGITIWKTTGTYAAPITIIGVNSSWVDDGTMDTIDGYDVMSGTTTAANIVVYKTGGVATLYYYHFKNTVFNRGKTSNIYNVALNTNESWWFHNCKFMGGAATTQCIKNASKWQYTNCTFANAAGGCITGALVHAFINCLFYNVQYGCLGVDGNYSQCVFTGKGGTSGYCGISPYNLGINVTGCVIDSFGSGLLFDKGTVSSVSKCKITNNAAAPIKINANYRVLECNNLFIGNGNSNTIDNAGALVSCKNSVYTGTIGYTNKAALDFSPTINATGRRVKVNIGVK